MRSLFFPGINANRIKAHEISRFDQGDWVCTPIPSGAPCVIEMLPDDTYFHFNGKTVDVNNLYWLVPLRTYLAGKLHASKITICGVICDGGECESGKMIPKHSLIITDICSTLDGKELYGQPLMKRLAELDRAFPAATMIANDTGLHSYSWIGFVCDGVYKALTYGSIETCETFNTIADATSEYPFYCGLLLRNGNVKLDYLYNASYNTHQIHWHIFNHRK